MTRTRGVSLIFALITLAVLALAAIGLLRSVDTSARILGNLGLKHDVLRYNDNVAEQAITWIKGKTTTQLQADIIADGYYATSLAALDPTGRNTNDAARALVDWDLNTCAGNGSFSGVCKRPAFITLTTAETDKGISSAAYVITRLCTSAGSATGVGNNCAVPGSSSTVSSTVRGSISYGDSLRATGTAGQFYRILVRTKGARNTIAFTETIVHF